MPPAAAPSPDKPTKCANCGREAVDAYRPFCSRRCADIDLGRWLKGSYAIPGNVDADEDGERPAPEPESGPTG